MMLTTTALDVIVAETYALHTIVTNVGIDPEEVSITAAYAANLSPPGYCAVLIVQRGSLSLKVPVAPLKREDCSRYLEAWLAFARAKKALSTEALDRMLYRSAAWETRTRVLCALAAKGFHLTAGIPN